MERVRSSARCDGFVREEGNGPPLVLVHGAFSDHETNWTFVRPALRERFSVCAMARRGRGETDATESHSLEDEAMDVVAVIDAIGEPVFLLGYCYGAHCGLVAASLVPDRVRKLVLYEPAWPHLIAAKALRTLEELVTAGTCDDVAFTFFRDMLRVPVEELEALRPTDLWAPIVAAAPASLGDLRALYRYEFDAGRFETLDVPVLLQVGSESPRDLYVTDALATVLPDSQVESLPGQAHEGMTTAPEMYVESVTRFLVAGSR
jgi:pimeloyl-ACP methyl ester carboxylesterase